MSIGLRLPADDLLLGLAVWMCTLPLVALIAVPRWGLEVAGAVAFVSLILALTICCLFMRRHGRQL